MKISVIGAGNVGGMTAMRLAQQGLGEVVLFDVVKGLAQGKVFDMEDASGVFRRDYSLTGTQDWQDIAGSGIIVVTAGLARRPGMSREDLLKKNAGIIREVCLNIKRLAAGSVVVMVTNPLDLMTCHALKNTGFEPSRVFGMGVSLDAARFTGLISRELGISNQDIRACVIGSHGEGMLPLPRLTLVKDRSLQESASPEKVRDLVKKTTERGAQIVSLLGNSSAYFAPSAAISEIVESIVRDKKQVIGVSAWLNGEYGLKDVCIGVPCQIGNSGIAKVVELELNEEEIAAFLNSAGLLKKQLDSIRHAI